MPARRTTYHTQVKFLARDGLLPIAVLEQIPRSNIYRWKSESPQKYQHYDINLGDSHDREPMKTFAKHRAAKGVFSAYVRIIKMLTTLAHTLPDFHKTVKTHSQQVVGMIKRVTPAIGLKRALRFFNISVPTFRQWSVQSSTQCFESLTGACNRIFPNQLSKTQLSTLKALLVDARFQYWPVSSIAFYALRKNILPLSLNTWYKYVHKLGINRPTVSSRRKKTIVGIRARAPHQLWHADITIFVTADQVKHYIYCVVDNFSRKILDCRATSAVTAAFRRQTILEAWRNVDRPVKRLTLMTDGGPENNLKLFLRDHDLPLDHETALIDIQYSNSLIEAHNKILKYNYLYRTDVKDGAALTKVLPVIVEDFNNRPHVSLDGLTPNEAEQNITIDQKTLSVNIRQATIERKAYNKLHQCGHCK